jgi:uncharacterized protein
MQGSLLRFYFHEEQRHRGRLVWEWLLDEASKAGIRGGSAFKSMAGFGRHHVVQEAQFFELAGKLSVEVEFVVVEAEARTLIDLVQREQVRSFYAEWPARFGVINPDAADAPVPS